MTDNNDKIMNLLTAASEKSIDLALTLIKSQKIDFDFEPFFKLKTGSVTFDYWLNCDRFHKVFFLKMLFGNFSIALDKDSKPLPETVKHLKKLGCLTLSNYRHTLPVQWLQSVEMLQFVGHKCNTAKVVELFKDRVQTISIDNDKHLKHLPEILLQCPKLEVLYLGFLHLNQLFEKGTKITTKLKRITIKGSYLRNRTVMPQLLQWCDRKNIYFDKETQNRNRTAAYFRSLDKK